VFMKTPIQPASAGRPKNYHRQGQNTSEFSVRTL
jgi:hypothetical protein